MTRLSPVLSTLDLPFTELSAARLDGDVYAIDDCFSPVDVVESALTRARSVAAVVPTRLIAEQHTAAWIWGARLTPPAPHQFCSPAGVRAKSASLRRFVVREVTIERDETIEFGVLRVTTPLRTATDIARFAARFGRADADAVRRLMLIGRFSLDECARALDRRPNLPLKKRAWQRLLGLYESTAAVVPPIP